MAWPWPRPPTLGHIHEVGAIVAGPKPCLKYIVKKVYQANPHISLRAITLLDGCVQNAGNIFAREMSSREPQLKITEMAKKWSEEYRSNPELSLLVSLYDWILSEHPDRVHEMEQLVKAANSEKERAAARGLQAKEEEDLAKAIALSLSETGGKPPGGNTMVDSNLSSARVDNPYPTLNAPAAGSKDPNVELGKVRALFDFEAAEDNELTFKAGEIILLLDTSDVNWWRGRNHRGEGLFPAQFVTRDLDEAKATPGQSEGAEQKGTNAGASAAPDGTAEKPVTIDAQLLANCLQMLNDADSTGVLRPDPPELPQMEARCRAMEPLIDREMQEVDLRISDVSDLEKKLVEAMQQYHDLMSRAPAPLQQPQASTYGAYMPQKPYGTPQSMASPYQVAMPSGPQYPVPQYSMVPPVAAHSMQSAPPSQAYYQQPLHGGPPAGYVPMQYPAGAAPPPSAAVPVGYPVSGPDAAERLWPITAAPAAAAAAATAASDVLPGCYGNQPEQCHRLRRCGESSSQYGLMIRVPCQGLTPSSLRAVFDPETAAPPPTSASILTIPFSSSIL
ncbi:Signal transducing adapter molecule 2 [Sparganum proliferum]